MEHPNPQHFSVPHKSHSASPFRRDWTTVDDFRRGTEHTTISDRNSQIYNPNTQTTTTDRPQTQTILITRGILLANRHLTLMEQQHQFSSTFVGSNGRGFATSSIPLPHFLRFSATKRSAVQGQKVPHEHGSTGKPYLETIYIL